MTGIANICAMVVDNVRYWLQEYHFDGLRLDAIHAIKMKALPIYYRKSKIQPKQLQKNLIDG